MGLLGILAFVDAWQFGDSVLARGSPRLWCAFLISLCVGVLVPAIAGMVYLASCFKGWNQFAAFFVLVVIAAVVGDNAKHLVYQAWLVAVPDASQVQLAVVQ